jgi:pimeloyl-ACP methyl ester carboxylesterase
MPIPTLAGIAAKTIATKRLTTRVLFSGDDAAIPVLFLHGNTSSATWWEETMVSLPKNFRGIAPDQRGFGDSDPAQKIDATRGVMDWVDDAIALLDHLGIARAHVVGSSLGGSVVWRMLSEQPARFISAIQVDPGSPFGFGGTKDLIGTPCWDDFAGSGGGLANPELIKRLQASDLSTESPFSPRNVLRTLILKPPFIPRPEFEDALVMSMCAMHIGPQDNPGDAVKSAHWPFIAPGVFGAANALAPKYAGDVSRLFTIHPKPKILWMRGSHDILVSDTAMSDVGFLGMQGLIPGWPGKEIFPPQPMIGQTRAVLEQYGAFQEVVIQDAGHAPYVDKLDEFNRVLHQWLVDSG